MESQKKAVVYALLTVLLWSTVASVFKLTLVYIDYTTLLVISSITSTLVLFVILILGKGQVGFRSMTRRQWMKSAILGFLNPFLYYLVLFKAYSLLPAQEAQPLNYTWGIVVTLLSVPLLGQKIRLINIIALIVSFAGVIVISTHGDVFRFRLTNPLGVLLAIGSSVIWALYWIYNLRDSRPELMKLSLNFMFGTGFVLVYYLFTESLSIPDARGALGGVYTGIVEMGITYVLWLKALKYARNTASVSNLIYLSPFLSLFFINLLVGEDIMPASVLGLGLIITGIVIQQYGTRFRRS